MNSMKKFPKLILTSVFLIVILMCLPGLVHAQPGNDCDYQDPDLYCPIDSGVWILLAAGLTYGFIKWRSSIKRQFQK